MDFFNKVSKAVKDLGDMAGDAVKVVGDKASDAVEIGKLSAKVSSEKHGAADDIQKIGEYYYSLFVEGGEVAPEVLGYCNSAKAHYDLIADYKAQMERLKAEGPESRATAAEGAGEETFEDVQPDTESSVETQEEDVIIIEESDITVE